MNTEDTSDLSPEALSQGARSIAAPVVEWLLEVRAEDKPERETFKEYVERLREIGLPIDRCTFHPAQLDSQILGRSNQWEDGEVKVSNFEHGIETTDFALKSPVWQIRHGYKNFIRQRLIGPDRTIDYPIAQELADKGYSDYVMFTITFSNGWLCPFSIATRREGGFTDLDLEVVRSSLKAFGAVADLRNSRETAARLLDTYIGRNAGERVLMGQIKRGDVEEVHAVILFCDMRDSTQLSEALDGESYPALLNEYFGVIGQAVESRGGEILKFIGDGLLAIFPCKREAVPDCDATEQALWAVEAAIMNLGDVSEGLEARGYPPLRTGFALHVGDVLYGNIGSAGRLDFTVTGPAVNKVSRLEALTKETGEDIIVSEELRKRSARLPDAFKDLGEFELRGIQGKHRAYAAQPVLL